MIEVVIVDDQDLVRIGLRTPAGCPASTGLRHRHRGGCTAVPGGHPHGLLGVRHRRPAYAHLTPQLDQLTDRQREVVSLLAEGLSNQEIGERLFVSPATARTHVSRAMIKLGARDRARLVVFAYQCGLA